MTRLQQKKHFDTAVEYVVTHEDEIQPVLDTMFFNKIGQERITVTEEVIFSDTWCTEIIFISKNFIEYIFLLCTKYYRSRYNSTYTLDREQDFGFKEGKKMIKVPEARKAMDQFKMEAANEVGVPLPS